MRIKWAVTSFFILVMLLLFYKGMHLNQRVLNSTLIGSKLPESTLSTLAKEPIAISSIKGPYVLNVFASWCPACKYEHAFWHKKSNYKIFGLAYKDNDADLSDWLKLYGNPYKKVLLDPEGKYAIKLGVYGTPETFLIDKLGVIVYRHVGPLSEGVWQQKFLPVLEQK